VGFCYILVYVTYLDNDSPFADGLYLANKDGIEMEQTGRQEHWPSLLEELILQVAKSAS